MTEKRLCPKCGTELSTGVVQGLCPKCLLDEGLESQAENAESKPAEMPSPTSGPTILQAPKRAVPDLEQLAQQFPQLDQFEHLGHGGMGVVYKARQRQLNRLVAVKVLPPSVGSDPAFAERFTREAQALARLNHQNIVQVYDFGQTAEFFYFVMEFVDGVNIRALIRDGNLQPEEVLKIVPQICEALQFAHDEGIVHRDIKPENILIDKKGRVKIADFGLAKLLGQGTEDLSLTGTGQVMGTLGYMAPEQMQQSHSVDHRADIYSLGVVLYEMLTGQLPFGRFQPPSQKVQVDVRLDEVVLRSLESEPGRRYQHASDVKTDVEAISSVASSPRPDAVSPIREPAIIEQDNAKGRAPRTVMEQLRIPAIGLIVTGVLNLPLLPTGVAAGGPPVFDQSFRLVGIAVGTFLVLAGINLLRTQSRFWALTAIFLAPLPIGPGFLVGLPLAIWLLIVLTRPDVKAAFHNVARQSDPTEDGPARESTDMPDETIRQKVGRSPTALLIVGSLGFAGLVVAVLLAFLLSFSKSGQPPSSIPNPTGNAPPQEEIDPAHMPRPLPN